MTPHVLTQGGGRLLCRLGFHRWGEWSYTAVGDPPLLHALRWRECERCPYRHVEQIDVEGVERSRKYIPSSSPATPPYPEQP